MTVLRGEDEPNEGERERPPPPEQLERLDDVKDERSCGPAPPGPVPVACPPERASAVSMAALSIASRRGERGVREAGESSPPPRRLPLK